MQTYRRCRWCTTLVDKPKHTCQYCAQPVCRNHRRKIGTWSVVYECVPTCRIPLQTFVRVPGEAYAGMPQAQQPQQPAPPPPAQPTVFLGYQSPPQNFPPPSVNPLCKTPQQAAAPPQYISVPRPGVQLALPQRYPPQVPQPPQQQQQVPSPSQIPSPSCGTSSHAEPYVPFPVAPPIDENGQRNVKLGGSWTLISAKDEALQWFRVRHNSVVEISRAHGTPIRGIILGVLNNELVWQPRGSDSAEIITSGMFSRMTSLRGGRCRHCGIVIPMDETKAHIRTHLEGASDESGTAVETEHGTCCGEIKIISELKREKLLGSGAQGEVWLCSAAQGNFVLKSIKLPTPDEAQARYQQSVRFMSLKHTHLIRYVGVQLLHTEPTVNVLMPFYEEGDLMSHLRGASFFSEEYVGSIALQIAGALEYLHTHKPMIIHGDIKPSNVLMFNGKNQVLLMDLDTSIELLGRRSIDGEINGTHEWMAPEALNAGHETEKSDVWSLGLVLYVLLVLPDFPMIEGKDRTAQLLNSARWSFPPESDELVAAVQMRILKRGYSTGIARLVSGMIHHDEAKRPTASQLLYSFTCLMENILTMGT